jgi:hypothetical protein
VASIGTPTTYRAKQRDALLSDQSEWFVAGGSHENAQKKSRRSLFKLRRLGISDS